MCGIFAYLGDRQALPCLITALKRLEYRGYDSAGIGIHNGKHIKICKKIGKVVNLETACGGVNNPEYAGTMGIAHTRWATHGAPTDANAHPHFTEDHKVAVVHNGIIENYASLREELIKKGYHFTSETDTELLAHLVADVRKQMGPDPSWSVIVSCALSIVTGAYGVVFIFEDEPGLMVGARKGSPLILGVGEGEFMLASDGSAVVEYTKDVVFIRDGELVEVRKSGYRLRTIEGISARGMSIDEDVTNPLVQLEVSLEQIEKGGYPHFMIKEIMDQPNCIRNTCRGRLYQPMQEQEGDSPPKWDIKLGGLSTKVQGTDRTALETIASADRIIICACGTSWHSGLIGEYLIEQLARINVEVEYASEFRYRNPLLTSKDVVVAISQSGETADTLEAIRIAKSNGALSIGIVNCVGSTIARDTDAGIYLHAGPEIGVASTKAFTSQVMVLTLLALTLARQRYTIEEEYFYTLCEELHNFPQYISTVLNTASQVKTISKFFRMAHNFLFLGRGIHFPVALEGALKLKEISYIHAEGYPAAEMKHGPIALIDRMMPVVCIAPKSDPTYDKVKANIEEVKARDGELIIITEEGNHDLDRFVSDEEYIIRIPSVDVNLEPIIAVIPLQLLSYYIADLRGCSIDQPRNLAKSVTVE
ncbi:conserved hypothetical protein [Perkinsus marinus ATCC 50983]|uniref:Glutamine--fructose-6-phosphate aminotransferase [isomerizing] n=1 Tax=Perkinsus marinus (strain ATCC 50983 / TXsc) TaxID=423536 RepID=C5LH98_PERM5|nr:conserved hypothetical protein [Perkinsus marinus ATCC 50983]EER03907.1 conserved hypothetical protein [Perkinsus marinus ATCC 50983]|eukprot:XP_002772091.1 conserved hypothetical protein [Perkinsus marinus ATCC 50983]